MTYISLLPLLAGVVIIIIADAKEKETVASDLYLGISLEPSHVKGLVFSFLGVFVMVAAQIYGKELMTWDPVEAQAPQVDRLTVPSNNHWRLSPPTSTADSSTTQKFSLSPKSIAKNFTRRNSNARLPYSISDLNLNDLENKPQTTQYAAAPYVNEVQEARASVNPLASLTGGAIKPDKLTIILYISIIGFSISSMGFLTNEARDLYDTFMGRKMTTVAFTDKMDVANVMMKLAFVALCSFCQSMISYLLLGFITALSYSIASMLKRIVLILVSMILASDPARTQGKWFGKISSAQLQGIVLMGLGLYSYDNWGSKTPS